MLLLRAGGVDKDQVQKKLLRLDSNEDYYGLINETRSYIEKPNARGQTAYKIADDHHNKKILELFGHHADYKQLDHTGNRNTIEEAIRDYNGEKLEELLESLRKNTNDRAQEKQGLTPLHLACKYRRNDLVDIFLSLKEANGVSHKESLFIHDDSSKYTPLLTAVEGGNYDCFKYIFDYLCDEIEKIIKEKDKKQHTKRLNKIYGAYMTESLDAKSDKADQKYVVVFCE